MGLIKDSSIYPNAEPGMFPCTVHFACTKINVASMALAWHNAYAELELE